MNNYFKRAAAKKEYSPNHPVPEHVCDEQILYWAKSILGTRLKRSNYLTSPDTTRDFLKVCMGNLEREVFSVILLDSQHGILAFEELFQGTVDAAAVYPREIVKAALAKNASAVILSHNHPSGSPEPSRADIDITNRIHEALKTVDIRLLDHLLVCGDDISSFAEQGLL
ncbi:MAG: DNA repair protein RadC [Cellvibrionaceae bacterium]